MLCPVAIGNVYQCIGGDVLHSDDIDGPFGLLVSLLPRWAHDTFGAAEGAALVQLANQRLLDANGGCAGPFRIPAVEDGYIGTSARVSAQEHRNVMQEMPMAVRGVFVTRAAGLQDDPVSGEMCLCGLWRWGLVLHTSCWSGQAVNPFCCAGA